MWNRLIEIRDKHPSNEVVKKANAYLDCLNTAGGSNIMGKEIKVFIDEVKTGKTVRIVESYYEHMNGKTAKIVYADPGDNGDTLYCLDIPLEIPEANGAAMWVNETEVEIIEE